MFLPENIDLAHSEKYSLSIRLTPNGFSFYFQSSDDPNVFHFQKTDLSNKLSYSDNIKKLIFDLGFFTHSFKKTTVIIVSPNYTLVPRQLFEAKKSKEIMDFNFHDMSGIKLHDSSVNKDYSVVFNMDEEVHSFLSRHLINPEFKHHSAPLLNVFNTYTHHECRKQCFVFFHDGFVSVFCYFEDKLLSANTFHCDNKPDTTYYLASIWEKLSLDQTKDTLYLSGDIDSYLTVVNDLKILIKNVERINMEPKTTLTKEQLNSLPTDVIAALCV